MSEQTLWHAILDPSGPNYQTWHTIFGENHVPLKSCHSTHAQLGEEKVEVYLLDLAGLSLRQRATLLGALSRKFEVPIYEIEAEINKNGFPIRAADVIVSISTRAFV